MYLTLRTGYERHGRKNPLPYSFSKRSHVGNLRQIRKQGKGRSSKRKENRRLSFLFAPAVGAATLPPSADGKSPAEVQRKTLRPLGANTLTQFARPGPPVQEKEPPRQGEHADAVRAPRSAGAEKEPPRQGEPACGSSCAPVSRCRKAPDSTRDKNFQENMRYPLAKYAKIGYYIQALFCMNSRMMLNDVKNTIIWRHSDYDRR